MVLREFCIEITPLILKQQCLRKEPRILDEKGSFPAGHTYFFFDENGLH